MTSIGEDWYGGATAPVLELHGRDVLLFINALAVGELDQAHKVLLIERALEPPSVAPETHLVRAQVLKQAYEAFIDGNHYVEPTLRALWGLDAKALARACLDPLERCAAALDALQADPAEQAHVLGLSGQDPSEFVARALDRLDRLDWAADRLVELHTTFLTVSTRKGGRGLIRRVEGVTELGALLLERDQAGRRTLTEELCEIVKRLARIERQVLSTHHEHNQRLRGSISSENGQVFIEMLCCVSANAWAEQWRARTSTQGGPVMLAYCTKDRLRSEHGPGVAAEYSVERLYDELLPQLPNLWVDWANLVHGEGPIILSIALILLLARGYLVAEGPSGLGPYQAIEVRVIGEQQSARGPDHAPVGVAVLQPQVQSAPAPKPTSTPTPTLYRFKSKRVELSEPRRSQCIDQLVEHLR